MSQSNQKYNILEVFEKNIYQSISIANLDDAEEELVIVNEIYEKKGIQILVDELRAVKLPYAIGHDYAGESVVIVTQGAASESLLDYLNRMDVDNIQVLDLIEDFLSTIRVYDAMTNLLAKLLINLEQVSVHDGKIVMSDLLIIDDLTQKPATFKDVTNNIGEIVAVIISKFDRKIANEMEISMLDHLFSDLQDGIKYSKIEDIYIDYKSQYLKYDNVKSQIDREESVDLEVKKAYGDLKIEKNIKQSFSSKVKPKVSDLEMLFGELDEKIEVKDRTQGAHAIKTEIRRVPLESADAEKSIYAKPQIVREVAKFNLKEESKEEAIEKIKHKLEDHISKHTYEFEKTSDEIELLKEDIKRLRMAQKNNAPLSENEMKTLIVSEVDKQLDGKIQKKIEESLTLDITNRYSQLQELIHTMEERIKLLEIDTKEEHAEELADTNKRLMHLKEQFDSLIQKFDDVECKVNADKELKLINEVYEYLNRDDNKRPYVKVIDPAREGPIGARKRKKKIKVTPKGYLVLSGVVAGISAVIYFLLN